MANAMRFSTETSPESDDDGSSSLSDIDEGPEPETISGHVRKKMAVADGDSEAETERLEISPNKAVKQEHVLVDFVPLDKSLPESSDVISAIHQMETGGFSNSAVSSPGSSDEDLHSDRVSERTTGIHDRGTDGSGTSQASAGQKRKRAVEENDSDVEEEQENRSRRKRTGSIRSDPERDTSTSEDDASSDGELSQTGSQGQVDVNEDEDDDTKLDVNDETLPNTNQSGSLIAASKVGKITASKARNSLHEGSDVVVVGQEDEDHVDGQEESDEEDLVEADEAEDAEAVARNEEEQAKRTAAMEALLDLEKRFATLRDRLYDERIAALNAELAQLSGPNPAHPELLRQVQCIQNYRDEKWEIEQKLLVFKIGALKRKSVAERSQIHSAYFQTIRDVRERHLERTSEHFYRIQRDRFKTDEGIPNYSIPFPVRRSQQITQQTAYNKEVSVLSGIAKYVGFPTAPDITGVRAAELDEDMEKMGISSSPLRAARPIQQPNARSAFSATLSRPAAEEFLEQTPWANPQHPAHQYLSHATRPTPVHSKRPQVPVSTPAGPKMHVDSNGGVGSASTIPEKSSAPPSSALNTPYSTDAVKVVDNREKGYSSDAPPERAGGAVNHNPRSESASPSEARKSYLNSTLTKPRISNDVGRASPPASRMPLFGSPTRSSLPRVEYEPQLYNQHIRESGLTARPGLGGIGAR